MSRLVGGSRCEVGGKDEEGSRTRDEGRWKSQRSED